MRGRVPPVAAGRACGVRQCVALGLATQVSYVVLAELVVADLRVHDGLLR
jgi:hypothetical protein